MNYRDALARANRRPTQKDQWELARSIYLMIEVAGISRRQIAKDLGFDKEHAARLHEVWRRYGDQPRERRPTFSRAYAEARQRKGPDAFDRPRVRASSPPRSASTITSARPISAQNLLIDKALRVEALSRDSASEAGRGNLELSALTTFEQTALTFDEPAPRVAVPIEEPEPMPDIRGEAIPRLLDGGKASALIGRNPMTAVPEFWDERRRRRGRPAE